MRTRKVSTKKRARPIDIGFQTWEQRRARPDGPEYRVMVFEPKGRYPRGTQHVPNGFFHADEEIAFSVVFGESWEALDPEVPYSEFAWASPQEMRLIACLVLCEMAESVRMSLYPIVRFGPLIDAVNLDLDSRNTVDKIRSLLLYYSAQAVTAPNEFTRLAEMRSPRTGYELIEPSNFAFNRLREFWDALSVPNYVLFRGVYALMKSDMLCRHYEFCEEAVISLQIALDASFSLVLRQLRREGAQNPTAHDAALWIHRHFDAAFGHDPPDLADRYFGDFYEQRIMTLHPASRFGDLPYSPTMHDDLSFLRPGLRQIFAYLLTGKHDPGYIEVLRDYKERGFL